MTRLSLYLENQLIHSIPYDKKMLSNPEYLKAKKEELVKVCRQEVNKSRFCPVYCFEGVQSSMNERRKYQKKNGTKTNRAKIIQLKQKGKSLDEITKEAGVCLRTVYNVLSEQRRKVV